MCVNNSSNFTFTISDIVSEGGWQASESALADLRPPEYILPGSNYRPLSPLQPVRDDRKVRSAFVTCKMCQNPETKCVYSYNQTM